ncbi:hypothetical protein ACC734_36090 [Rhizobium ruizarguesonis]
MCEPTFEEWLDSFAGELVRLTGEPVDFDSAYDRYWPTFENGICGGTCARNVARIGRAAEVYADEWEDAE